MLCVKSPDCSKLFTGRLRCHWSVREGRTEQPWCNVSQTPFKNTPTSWDQRISAWRQKKRSRLSQRFHEQLQRASRFLWKSPFFVMNAWLCGQTTEWTCSQWLWYDFYLSWDQSGGWTLQINGLPNPNFLLALDTTVMQLCCTHTGAWRVAQFNFSLCIANQNSSILHVNILLNTSMSGFLALSFVRLCLVLFFFVLFVSTQPAQQTILILSVSSWFQQPSTDFHWWKKVTKYK